MHQQVERVDQVHQDIIPVEEQVDLMLMQIQHQVQSYKVLVVSVVGEMVVEMQVVMEVQEQQTLAVAVVNGKVMMLQVALV